MAGKFWYTDSNGKRKRTAAGVKHEYEKFQSSAKAKAERASRNSARRSALKSGRVHKGDGKDIDHKDSTLDTTHQVIFGWFPAKQTAVKKRTLAREEAGEVEAHGEYRQTQRVRRPVSGLGGTYCVRFFCRKY